MFLLQPLDTIITIPGVYFKIISNWNDNILKIIETVLVLSLPEIKLYQPQVGITCLTLTIETLEQGVKYLQSQL